MAGKTAFQSLPDTAAAVFDHRYLYMFAPSYTRSASFRSRGAILINYRREQSRSHIKNSSYAQQFVFKKALLQLSVSKIAVSQPFFP